MERKEKIKEALDTKKERMEVAELIPELGDKKGALEDEIEKEQR